MYMACDNEHFVLCILNVHNQLLIVLDSLFQQCLFQYIFREKENMRKREREIKKTILEK